jgi:hypothetical protein
MNPSSSDSQAQSSNLFPAPAPRRMDRRLGGFLIRRPCWTLSLAGKFLVLAVVGVLGFGAIRFIHPFLAVNHPVPADVLIIEGWIPTDTMRAAAREFQNGGYRQVIVMRPISDNKNKYESGRYMGDYMANLLVQYGVPQSNVTTLFPVVAQKDRTYHAALAARQWLKEQGLSVKSLDVATLGPHARRSRLLYEKAFGGEVNIGIIALPNQTYDPAHWWRYSEGVREVLSESIAYLYARLLFFPSMNPDA